METTIDIKNYLTEEEIRNICEDQLRSSIAYQFRQEREITRLISNLSYEFMFKVISSEIGCDSFELILKKVKELIEKGSDIRYLLFHRANDYDKIDSPSITMINKALKDNEDLIRTKVVEAISKYSINEDEFREFILSVIDEKLFLNKKNYRQ